MAKTVKKLEKRKEIDLTSEVRKKLFIISVSTIDRLLKPERDRYKLGKGRKGTKPGTLLKRQYNNLNPAELKRKISKLQDKLLKLNSLKKALRRNSTVDKKSYEYIYFYYYIYSYDNMKIRNPGI